MKEIAIAGAGPMGLLLAIRLKQLGYENITLVDARAGTYTRPGILNASIFEELTQLIGLPVDFSDSYHLKDVERSLYKIAESLNIKIMKANFTGFEGKALRVEDEHHDIHILPCDLAIDATGSRRALVNEINRLFPDAFSVQPIADPSHKKHLMAYVKVEEKTDSDPPSTPAPYGFDFMVQKLEELRAMGWKGFVEPGFYALPLAKNKTCFYVEIPENLDASQHEKWLKTVVAFHTGKDNFDYTPASRKYGSKPRFLTFIVDPHQVNEAFFQHAQFPCVIPVGDAQIEPDYRIGIGIKSGAYRIKCLLDAMVLEKDQEFHIDFEKYQKELAAAMQMHAAALSKFYQEKQRSHEHYANLLSIYETVIASASMSKQKELQPSFAELIQAYAQSLYDAGNNALESI